MNEQELLEEAKTRYKIGDCIDNGSIVEGMPNEVFIEHDNLKYDELNQKIYMGSVMVYCYGHWAEKVKNPLAVIGNKVAIGIISVISLIALYNLIL